MQRPWLDQYPQGVPAQVDASAYPTLLHLLDESFKRYRSQQAFTCMDQPMSYGELDQASLALAGWLQAHGMRQGDRIAIMLPNLLQYPVAAAAILRMGGIVVNVNPLYTPRELRHQLADSGARGIVILENFAHTLEEVLPDTQLEHIIVASIGDMFRFPKDA